ncbi:hypothetical protein [uncultured Jannaschia sp.]|uniref:hypothetical protein n=1 Tax=uncultured Jannaschia sp. TaxID=293347 RepID=UPI002633D50A|nr:hypothetical protein [uncultured Jannaschia sp.]
MRSSALGALALGAGSGAKAQSANFEFLRMTQAAVGGNSESSPDAWNAIRAALKEKNDWLSVFDESYEEAATDGLVEISIDNTSNPVEGHNPHLVEPLLGEASELINRCFEFRSIGQSLEEDGIKVALDIELFAEMSELDDLFFRASLESAPSEILASAYNEASQVFSANDAPLSAGFATEMRGLSEAHREDRVASDSRRAIYDQTSEMRRNARYALYSQHFVKGGALNFAERYLQYKNLFIRDIHAALKRMKFAQIGLRPVFGINWGDTAPFPSPEDGTMNLDAMSEWVTSAMRAVSKVLEQEMLFDKTILLGKTNYIGPPTDGNGNILQDGIKGIVSKYSDKQYGDYIKSRISGKFTSGRLEFSLEDAFPYHRSVRLRSIGLSFTTAVSNDDLHKVSRALLRAEVYILKNQHTPIHSATSFVDLAEVSLLHSKPVQYATGAGLYNVDPRGKFQVRWYRVQAPLETNENWLSGFAIHLRVSADDRMFTRNNEWWTAK